MFFRDLQKLFQFFLKLQRLGIMSLGLKILGQLAQHIARARLGHVRRHQSLNILLRLLRIQPHHAGGPGRCQLGAPRLDTELEFLVVRKLVLEGAFTVLQCGHGKLRPLAWGALLFNQTRV